MPQRRQQDPRRIGQLAQYHPGGGDVRSRGRSQGPLTGDPSVTAPTERTAPAQQSPLFAGGPGEPPQLERDAPVDPQLAGEGLMAPGFGGDTDMQALPAPTEGGKPTSVRSDPGLQAPIPPPIPEPIPDRAGPDRAGEGDRPRLPDVRVTEPGGGDGPAPTGMLPPPRPPQDWPSDIYPDYSPGPRKPPSRLPENIRPVFEVDYVPDYGEGKERGPIDQLLPIDETFTGRPDIRRAPPPPPGPPRGGTRIDWMPGDPGYNPDEGRGMWPPGDPGRRQQRDTDRERERMLSDIAGRGLDREQQQDPWSESLANRGRDRGQQRERDMQRAQRRDARRARPLRA